MATALAPRIYGLDAIGAAAGTEEAQAFARRLYERVADKDLAAASAEQRAAAALALLAFARRRLPGVAKVRVFNPTAAEHGFESRHTIVQIVNDDMPFLVDSIANELNRRELGVHLLAHPVMPVRRDLDGDLLEFADADERAPSESLMQIEIDRQADPAQRDDLAAALARVLAEVRLAVGDWKAMRQAAVDAVEDLAPARSRRGRGIPVLARGQSLHLPRPSPLPLCRGHRAARRHPLRDDAGIGARHPAPRRGPAVRGRAGRRRGDGAVRARAADAADRQDRPRMRWSIAAAPMDCVIVKTLDADGRATGERRFAGLFTSTAYHTPVLDVPLLRDKVEQVLRRAGLDRNSHDGKALLAILDTYPRDELFQIDRGHALRARARHPAAAGAPPGGAVRRAAIPSGASRAAWCSCRANASMRR